MLSPIICLFNLWIVVLRSSCAVFLLSGIFHGRAAHCGEAWLEARADREGAWADVVGSTYHRVTEENAFRQCKLDMHLRMHYMLESALCLLYISVFIIDSSRSSTMATPLNHTEGIGKSLQDQEVNTAVSSGESSV
jgi:hypothetical protein